MRIQLNYFGILCEIAQAKGEFIDEKCIQTIADLRRELLNKYSAFQEIPLLFFSNDKKCSEEQPLSANEIIDCMPPFSGG